LPLSGRPDFTLMASPFQETHSDPSPEYVPAIDDPGDDIGRRFAYQWSYAAIMACGALDENSHVEEVFCEHHEDILIKLRTGRFCGVQIKTRNPAGDPFKANDEEVLNAISKFAKLENAFGHFFEHFSLCTNHAFRITKNRTSLPHILDLAQSAAEDAPPPILASYLNRIAPEAATPAGCALRTLRKTKCDHALPKLDSIKDKLCNAIYQSFPLAADVSHRLLLHLAELLQAEAQRAATLDNLNAVPLYLSIPGYNANQADRLRIDGKRLTKDRILKILRDAIAGNPPLTPEQCKPENAAFGMTELTRKLSAGGLSITTINNATTLTASAINLYFRWQNKLGPERAMERYGQIKAIVLNICSEAHEITKTADGFFGPKMLIALRDKLSKYVSCDPDAVFRCRKEHLEGFAFELTRSCLVWWSNAFNLLGGDEHGTD
jgi:hypothetical protein